MSALGDIMAILMWKIISFLGAQLLWKAWHTAYLMMRTRWGSKRWWREKMKPIVLAHTMKNDGRDVHDEDLHVQREWFVDLMSGVMDEKTLSWMTMSMLMMIRHQELHPDRIAVPKLGNVLLGRSVATSLNRPLVVIRPEESQQWRRGRAFDGEIRESDSVVLVDDVASKGSFLKRCVEVVEQSNAEISHIIVLVERTEYRCQETLGGNVTLVSLMQLSDESIKLDREERGR